MLTEDMLPGCAHPAYTDQAESIRNVMTIRRDAVFIPRLVSKTATHRADGDDVEFGEPLETDILTIRQCATKQVPWVGWPVAYSWFVAVDKLGRGVGDTPERTERHTLPDLRIVGDPTAFYSSLPTYDEYLTA